MKRDFRQMEDQMEKLNENIESITKLSSDINKSMKVHMTTQFVIKF